LAHPRANPHRSLWLGRALARGPRILNPEIADYDVRRSLPLENLSKPLARLVQLKAALVCQPLHADAMLRAAELRAEMRRHGRHGRSAADPQALDGDVILAPRHCSLALT
jgi:hypothetical protein